jgi:Reverse transcriptase (RNA-dependent DNA polymerase)
MANGIAEVIPLQPFLVRVVNTSIHECCIPRGMVLDDALPHPKAVISITEEIPGGERDSPVPHIPDVDGELWREEVDINHLLPQEQSQVLGMLERHRSMWDGRLGQVHAATHRIDLIPTVKPVHAQPYRAGPRARAAESAEIQRMLKEGVIEPATSEWASPVVLVPKSDSSTKFCVDHRRLNALTIRDSYPLPRMDEYIDSLGDAKLCSTLDCNSGYWQIPVEPKDKDKTTFTSHKGTFRSSRMPFGLTNAPATFQRIVNMTSTTLLFSRRPSSHLRHLGDVLSRLYGAGLSLKLRKCHFVKEPVSYLGHVIRPGQPAVAENNTAALKDIQAPTTQTELRSFLGLCNVYRRLVPHFSKIAATLNGFPRKGEGPKLGLLDEDQLHAFDCLREKLLNPPILALPR